jgi:hypothetical protein
MGDDEDVKRISQYFKAAEEVLALFFLEVWKRQKD